MDNKTEVYGLFINRYRSGVDIELFVTHCIITTTGVLLNFAVIILVMCSRRLQEVEGIAFVFNLSCANFLFCVQILFIGLSTHFEVIFSKHICNAFTATTTFSCIAASLSRCIVALDRYVYISDPLHYYIRSTESKIIFLITCLWFGAGCLTLAPYMTELLLDRRATDFRCLPHPSSLYTACVLLLGVILPMLYEIYVYTRIFFWALLHIQIMKQEALHGTRLHQAASKDSYVDLYQIELFRRASILMMPTDADYFRRSSKGSAEETVEDLDVLTERHAWSKSFKRLTITSNVTSFFESFIRGSSIGKSFEVDGFDTHTSNEKKDSGPKSCLSRTSKSDTRQDNQGPHTSKSMSQEVRWGESKMDHSSKTSQGHSQERASLLRAVHYLLTSTEMKTGCVLLLILGSGVGLWIPYIVTRMLNHSLLDDDSTLMFELQETLYSSQLRRLSVKDAFKNDVSQLELFKRASLLMISALLAIKLSEGQSTETSQGRDGGHSRLSALKRLVTPSSRVSLIDFATTYKDQSVDIQKLNTYHDIQRQGSTTDRVREQHTSVDAHPSSQSTPDKSIVTPDSIVVHEALRRLTTKMHSKRPKPYSRRVRKYCRHILASVELKAGCILFAILGSAVGCWIPIMVLMIIDSFPTLDKDSLTYYEKEALYSSQLHRHSVREAFQNDLNQLELFKTASVLMASALLAIKYSEQAPSTETSQGKNGRRSRLSALKRLVTPSSRVSLIESSVTTYKDQSFNMQKLNTYRDIERQGSTTDRVSQQHTSVDAYPNSYYRQSKSFTTSPESIVVHQALRRMTKKIQTKRSKQYFKRCRKYCKNLLASVELKLGCILLAILGSAVGCWIPIMILMITGNFPRLNKDSLTYYEKVANLVLYTLGILDPLVYDYLHQPVRNAMKDVVRRSLKQTKHLRQSGKANSCQSS